MRKLWFLIFFVSLKSYGLCPDTSKKETASDCPWADVTREINETEKSCDSVLKARTPFILKQLKLDKNSTAALSLWGTAKNFDENAKATIVEIKVLQCLAEKLNLQSSIEHQSDFTTVHAGLQHTYAYLFSNLLTPYGYKRLRWTKNDIENGLGLHHILSPETKSGSFLTNVTYVFAKLALGDADLIKHKSLAPELLKFDPKAFEVTELKETISNQNLILHTTFVKLLPGNKDSSNSHLLIYWIENTDKKTKLLITGFPVEQNFVNKALDEKSLGLEKPISLRYNAWAAELVSAKAPLVGKRELIK